MSDALPNIAKEKIDLVLKRLSELGVEDAGDLENVEVDDLTGDGLLKPIQARKLVKRWKKGIESFIYVCLCATKGLTLSNKS